MKEKKEGFFSTFVLDSLEKELILIHSFKFQELEEGKGA